MRILIQTKPIKEMRYPTVGDWVWTRNENNELIIEIIVAKFSNETFEFFVAVHELIEAFFCMRKGLSTKEVDKYDFEQIAKENYEPGELKNCPYRGEHLIASEIEFQLVDYVSEISHPSHPDALKEYIKEADNLIDEYISLNIS
jgi:hypothetical protein